MTADPLGPEPAEPLAQGARVPSENRPEGADPLGQSPRVPSEDRPGGDPPVQAVDPEAQAPADEATEVTEPDYKDLYLRAAAEAENVRKRARRDVDNAQARGVARLARELLPALDNLDRAIAAAEDDGEVVKGIRLVSQELLGAMGRVGIEAYSPQGEVFDPHVHEAVAKTPTEGAEPGTVVQVYQAGYRYEDEVLRAAKVVVAA